MFGQQPSKWRLQADPDLRTLLPALTADFLATINQPEFHHPTLIEQQEIVLIGMMAGEGDPKADLWESLFQVSGVRNAARKQVAYDGVRSPSSGNPASYFAGATGLESLRPTPPLAAQILPAGPYVAFEHPVNPAAQHHALAFTSHTWLAQSAYTLAASFQIEAYNAHRPAGDPQTTLSWLYIPLKAVFTESDIH